MSDYSDQVARFRANIEAKGASVDWKSIVIDSDEPGKPWLAGNQSEIITPVHILFLPIARIGQETLRKLIDTEVPTGNLYGLLPYYSEFKPKLKDVVIREDKTLTVLYLDEFKPADQTIYYSVVFAK